jgi:hypothetical protein
MLADTSEQWQRNLILDAKLYGEVTEGPYTNHLPEWHKNGINTSGLKHVRNVRNVCLNTIFIHREYVVAGLSDPNRLVVYRLVTRYSKCANFSHQRYQG